MTMYKGRRTGVSEANGHRSVDRRVRSRYELTVPVTFLWKGVHGARYRGEGYTRDLSEHGIYVVTNTCPPLEANLRMELFLPPLKRRGAPVHMRGRAKIVRIESEPPAAPQGFAAIVNNFTLYSKTKEPRSEYQRTQWGRDDVSQSVAMCLQDRAGEESVVKGMK